MSNYIWKFNAFRSGTDQFFIIACNYALGLVEAFSGQADGSWHHLGQETVLDDVRLFYPCKNEDMPPILRANIRAYLTGPNFDSLFPVSSKPESVVSMRATLRSRAEWNQ
jgi:hypothetical protein